MCACQAKSVIYDSILRKNGFILERGENILSRAQANPATKGRQQFSLQSEGPYHPTATNMIVKKKTGKAKSCQARQKARASPLINTVNQVFKIPNATGIPSHGTIMRG
ncbi:uncharacterized protein N7500_003699 [Penicillium coprophilum]|uniref:uncharacterized protein n=1 Tax=Penicillium coprophilum TaxID=36646 RepID=UPI00238AFD38|nr:uncharacterized protein N7500_003699 [Penicillium coprophilum]KAJ5170916.1 hypothetical protein N7500_003699 [Penicillium coprophilum]